MKKISFKYYDSLIRDILILALILILTLPKFIISEVEKDIGFYCELVVFTLLSILTIYDSYKIIKKIKIHDEVLKKGMKIPGVIIRPEQEITYNEDGFKEKHYYLYVKYVDSKTNEEKEFKTEELAFNPFKKLKSNKCNVYIYNETIIAEDFEIAKNKEERVFEENNNFKPEKEIKKVDLITVLAIIMIVIASIIFICALLKKL